MFAKISEFLLGGTRGFNKAEERLLSFLMDTLSPKDREILSRQLHFVRKVQRQHAGRLVVAYYKKGANVPQLPYSGYEHCLANITYRSAGQTRTTSVVLHNGRLQTLEGSVPQGVPEIEALDKVVVHPRGFKSAIHDLDSGEHQQASGESVVAKQFVQGGRLRRRSVPALGPENARWRLIGDYWRPNVVAIEWLLIASFRRSNNRRALPWITK